MKGPCAVNLHNAVTVSQGRLGGECRLNDTRLSEVCAALRFSLGCDRFKRAGQRVPIDVDAAVGNRRGQPVAQPFLRPAARATAVPAQLDQPAIVDSRPCFVQRSARGP